LLGRPEDNLKSIVQAIFLLTKEMLCQGVHLTISILIPDVPDACIFSNRA
jgi:hypothetical protein